MKFGTSCRMVFPFWWNHSRRAPAFPCWNAKDPTPIVPSKKQKGKSQIPTGVFIKQGLTRVMYSRSEWQTHGDYIAFPGGSCVATLVYTVRLIQPGALHYTYQYPDDDTIFEFQVDPLREIELLIWFRGILNYLILNRRRTSCARACQVAATKFAGQPSLKRVNGGRASLFNFRPD